MGNIVDSILYQPPKPSHLKDSKIIWIKTVTNTKIPAVFIEYDDRDHIDYHCHVSRAAHKPITILYSHANAEDIGCIYPWCKYLSRKLRVNVFAYDYTGYGLAYEQGPPNESQCYADIDAAYNYLRHTLHIPAKQIVLYGRSLGSGPSTYLASRTSSSREDTVGGLILHAPFLSVFRIVIDSGCTLVGDQFPNVDFFPEIETPTLLIHGTSDKVVPFQHSLMLLETLRPEFRAEPFFRDMGHNNVPLKFRDSFIAHVYQYLEDHVRHADRRRRSDNSEYYAKPSVSREFSIEDSLEADQ